MFIWGGSSAVPGGIGRDLRHSVEFLQKRKQVLRCRLSAYLCFVSSWADRSQNPWWDSFSDSAAPGLGLAAARSPGPPRRRAFVS